MELDYLSFPNLHRVRENGPLECTLRPGKMLPRALSAFLSFSPVNSSDVICLTSEANNFIPFRMAYDTANSTEISCSYLDNEARLDTKDGIRCQVRI